MKSGLKSGRWSWIGSILGLKVGSMSGSIIPYLSVCEIGKWRSCSMSNDHVWKRLWDRVWERVGFRLYARLYDPMKKRMRDRKEEVLQHVD